MLLLGKRELFPREMILDDIYLLRLKLLLHMVEDYFEGLELSELRRQIVWENARHVQIESVDLGCLNWVSDDQDQQPAGSNDHVFYRSISELAALMKKIAEGQRPNKHLDDELRHNFKTIRNIQNSRDQTPVMPFKYQDI